MSKLRDEERAKRTLQENNDILLEIGKSGKKGDDAFKEHTKLEEKISKVKRDIVLEGMDKKKETLYYHKYLSDLLLNRIITTIDITSGWTIETMPSERGVVMELKSPDGRMFRSAFLATKDPYLDLNAIDNFAIRADATIERIKSEHIIHP
ncbi:hypothetical protein M0R04_10485 [Candidatus Dojkabacteria bacterium]|jgi:hypothetical protein|nr:hypothetical protein [Candidatus Dojkabacteria bacterium]